MHGHMDRHTLTLQVRNLEKKNKWNYDESQIASWSPHQHAPWHPDTSLAPSMLPIGIPSWSDHQCQTSGASASPTVGAVASSTAPIPSEGSLWIVLTVGWHCLWDINTSHFWHGYWLRRGHSHTKISIPRHKEYLDNELQHKPPRILHPLNSGSAMIFQATCSGNLEP